MKILMFSADPTILNVGSAAAKRMRRYRVMLDAESTGSKLNIFLLVRQSLMHEASYVVKIFSGRFFRFWKAFIEARKIFKTEKYDLITTQDIEHSFIAYLLAREFRVPWQMQIHTDIFSPYFWKHSWKNIARVLFAKWLIPKASCIRVVSERIKESLLKRWPELDRRITVLPILVSDMLEEGEQKYFPEFKKIILTVARLESEKNIALALEAMTKVRKKEPQAGLVIVGGGSLERQLKWRAKELGVLEGVRFEGNQNDVVPYYRGADVYIQTSLYEGFGRAVHDAMRFGLPVVMTNAGIAESFVQDGVNGFIRKTAPEIAEAIICLLQDENLRNEFGKKSKMFIKMSDEAEYFPEVIRLWQKCANS